MTNEESTERYWIEIAQDAVHVHDDRTEECISFFGSDRLLAATAELNQLNALEEANNSDLFQPVTRATFPAELQDLFDRADRPIELTGTFSSESVIHAMHPTQVTAAGKSVTPASFLAETLPAVARRQRLEAQLAEVTEIEERYTRLVSQDAKSLATATDLRRRIEEALARPLSATLPDENASPAAQGTTHSPEPLTRAQAFGPLNRPERETLIDQQIARTAARRDEAPVEQRADMTAREVVWDRYGYPPLGYQFKPGPY